MALKRSDVPAKTYSFRSGSVGTALNCVHLPFLLARGGWRDVLQLKISPLEVPLQTSNRFCSSFGHTEKELPRRLPDTVRRHSCQRTFTRNTEALRPALRARTPKSRPSFQRFGSDWDILRRFSDVARHTIGLEFRNSSGVPHDLVLKAKSIEPFLGDCGGYCSRVSR